MRPPTGRWSVGRAAGKRRAKDVNGKDAGQPTARDAVAPRRPLRLATPCPVGDGSDDLVVAFEIAPDPIALVDDTGVVVRWDGAWERELTYTPADLDGVAIGTLVHEGDRAALDGALEQVTSGRVAGATVEARVRTGAGDDRWYEWAIRPHPSGSRAFLWGRDVDRRRSDERRHRLLVERTPDTLCVLGPGGEVMYLNHGGVPGTEARLEAGDRVFSITHPDDVERLLEALAEGLR